MKPDVVINSPGHTPGTHEHLLVHCGSLLLKIDANDSVMLQAGDFYAFSGENLTPTPAPTAQLAPR